MTNDPQPRDEELGAALRSLSTPDHGDRFFDELDERLAHEERAVAGTRPSLTRRLPRRRSTRIAGTAVALAAVIAVTLAIVDGAVELGGTGTASAAEVKARVRASLAAMETLSGVLVTRCTETACPGTAGARRWRFVLSARGDLRLAGPTEDEVLTYDAETGVMRSAQRSASLGGGGPVFYAEHRGLAPGPPDAALPASFLEELGAFVRALLAAEDPRVREDQYAGRPAWRLDVAAVPNAIVPDFTGDRFEIVVDRGTGIPVRVVERKRGVVLRDLRVEQLAVDADVAPDTFRLAMPPAAEVARIEGGFRRVALDEVLAAVGYRPLVPTFVPDGFELSETAVAGLVDATGAEAGNPPSYKVVSLSYRRGFDQLVVTTRLARVPGTWDARWSDPLAAGEGYRVDPEPIVLAEGALAGARAEVLVVPRGIPHLWTEAEGLVVTVAGSLSRDELVRVAESLERS